MLHDFSEYMNEHQSVARQVGIRVCHSRDMSREQLQLLARTCPKLTHVSLYVDEDMGDLLTPLTGLIFLSIFETPHSGLVTNANAFCSHSVVLTKYTFLP